MVMKQVVLSPSLMYISGGNFCYISTGLCYHRNYYYYGYETSCIISQVSCSFQEETSVIYQLEGVTIETIITMVMKLSEATFKPFLYKVGVRLSSSMSPH